MIDKIKVYMSIQLFICRKWVAPHKTYQCGSVPVRCSGICTCFASLQTPAHSRSPETVVTVKPKSNTYSKSRHVHSHNRTLTTTLSHTKEHSLICTHTNEHSLLRSHTIHHSVIRSIPTKEHLLLRSRTFTYSN